MFYKYIITCLDEDLEEHTEYGVVYGSCYSNALFNVLQDYGVVKEDDTIDESCIVSMTLECLDQDKCLNQDDLRRLK